MRCKLLLQHYARYHEKPTAQVQEDGGGAIAKTAELVNGVTSKRKLCQIQRAQIQKSISSLIIFQTSLTDFSKHRKTFTSRRDCLPEKISFNSVAAKNSRLINYNAQRLHT